MKKLNIIMSLALAGILLVSSCASKRNLEKTTIQPSVDRSSIAKGGEKAQAESAQASQLRQQQFIQRVVDNGVYVKNIVGDMKFNLKAGSKDITVSGSLRMRKDEVIRIQLFMPLLGTEVGRLEFTPTYVLIIDRLHKEYVKADYTQLDFLQSNGLNFYSLQALFWNQLFLPGQETVADKDLSQYEVDLNAQGGSTVGLKQGNLSVSWLTESATARILSAEINYLSQKHGKSTLDWTYDDFMVVGLKQFPATQKFMFSTTATQRQQTATVTIRMNEVTIKDNWDATTKISDRYKQIAPQDILSKIMKF
ncbi:DUF4292 domain-containing protein [Prevotella sp. A2931]|uniref:DUF4292 domain-containing protein n=1 Tax=Prevotella illustrans TaxID=2800387 RepID=A0ABS3M8G8_9BACT|nr:MULTISPECIES: DUF4292 domain-containing protein [Prevotella]MBO1364467.1 DUF4292 domain-containing protein [Prevotella illustrans]PTL26568.1 DUF4292 domain-containing protein [Prevotella sp. oral taxon 820]